MLFYITKELVTYYKQSYVTEVIKYVEKDIRVTFGLRQPNPRDWYGSYFPSDFCLCCRKVTIVKILGLSIVVC